MAVFLFYILTKKISNFLKIENPDIPAFLSCMVYVFSLETLYSHGYIYWGHSLFQVFYILFVILCFISFSEEKKYKKKKRFFYYFFLSFFLCFIEWSGYTIIFTSLISFLLFQRKKGIHEIMGLISGTILSLLIFIGNFLSVVDHNDFFKALKDRFLARNITTQSSFFKLLKGYFSSFNLFLLLIPIGIICYMHFKKIEKIESKKVLYSYSFIFIGGIFENIIMKQHATVYHFDRLKLLLIFPLLISIIWASKSQIAKIITVIIIGIVCIFSIYRYPFERILIEDSLLKNRKIVENIKRECFSSILGTNSFVRGHFNLLINRGAYENVNKEELRKIATERNVDSFCFIKLDNYLNFVPRIQ